MTPVLLHTNSVDFDLPVRRRSLYTTRFRPGAAAN